MMLSHGNSRRIQNCRWCDHREKLLSKMGQIENFLGVFSASAVESELVYLSHLTVCLNPNGCAARLWKVSCIDQRELFFPYLSDSPLMLGKQLATLQGWKSFPWLYWPFLQGTSKHFIACCSWLGRRPSRIFISKVCTLLLTLQMVQAKSICTSSQKTVKMRAGTQYKNVGMKKK